MPANVRPKSPHDAEEVLRPYLGRVFDTADDAGVELWPDGVRRHIDALEAALDKALNLLGVRS